jgi:uncharacterized RDD family membrane protein YckC
LANYGPRLGGWLIDWLLMAVVGFAICALTHSIHYSHVLTYDNGYSSGYSSDTVHFSIGMPGVLLSPLVVLLYGTLMVGGRRGQTIGMRVTGIKAIKLSTGGRVGYGAALGRALFEDLMAVLFLVPWVIDQLFPLWDPMKQTLHDKVSGTVVVSAKGP